jgi:hypothetical protein
VTSRACANISAARRNHISAPVSTIFEKALIKQETEMTEAILNIDAFIEGSNQRAPLQITVFAPERTDQSEYACLVHAPSLLGSGKLIYGIDKEQAKSLAIGFVKRLLKDKRLVDGSGLALKLWQPKAISKLKVDARLRAAVGSFADIDPVLKLFRMGQYLIDSPTVKIPLGFGMRVEIIEDLSRFWFRHTEVRSLPPQPDYSIGFSRLSARDVMILNRSLRRILNGYFRPALSGRG